MALVTQYLSLLLIIIGGFLYSVFCRYVEFTSVHFVWQNGLMNDKNAIAWKQTMMNRYTPIPPIAPSAAESSDVEETESIGVSSDDEDSEDEETELDEDFQLTNKKYDDVKAAMKKRMLALSELDTFDNQVRSCPQSLR